MTPNKGAWHGDPKLKAEVLTRMLEHRVEDSIIQGTFQQWDPKLATQYRGCLIGCTLPMGRVVLRGHCCAECDAMSNDMERYIEEKNWHSEVTRLYGIPVELNHLLDGLFESLPADKAAWFALSSIEAIPVGGDLSVSVATFVADLKYELPAWVRDSSRWLKSAAGQHLESLTGEDPESFDGHAISLAERLLECLANAPVQTPAPPPEVRVVPTPAPEEVKV